MSLTEWVLYGGIIATALVVGVIGGIILAWRARQGLRVPEWAKVSPSRRLGAVVLSLLAILTVLSSMLTSYELRRVEAQRAAEAEASRACTQQLSERLAQRIRITDANQQNTADLVGAIQEAMSPGDQEGTTRAVMVAAAEYLERQEDLAHAKDEIPIRADACP